MKIYLAGPIRKGVAKDTDWRKYATKFLEKEYTILDPILRQLDVYIWDRKMIETSDIMLFNFEELGEGYPHIGALWECGLGDALGKVMVAFGPEKWMEHPFFKSKMIWQPDMDTAIVYLEHQRQLFGKE